MAFSFRQEILRKLIHLSSFWIVAFIWYFSPTWGIILLSLLSAFVLVAEYETFRKQDSCCAKIYRRLFMSVLRDEEQDGQFRLSGAPYVLISALILLVLVPKSVAMFALSVLLICDAMAALIGRRFGKHRLFGKKTYEGTLAFLISGFGIAFLFYYHLDFNLWKACIGVCLGCMGDLFNKKLHMDDNLSIPLLTALPFLF